ncbi:uncharacterized protein ccdc152 isoform X2 [Brachyhypopomus gauderio]|uniref:uncharacterized protein ccdc152 isoform X2 n=1 Tax=Brachyhypopomus gauderio TaxID=698409 RepID=UPI0040426D44
MKKTVVDLEKLLRDFGILEQRITELKGKNTTLEIRLDETSRILKFSHSKEKQLIEEREGMLSAISCLQNNLQQQYDARVENEKLKNTILDLKNQNEAQVKESSTCIQRLDAEMRAQQEKHQRELNDLARETQRNLESKDVEMKEALERKESALEEIRRKINDQEKEKQSEILRLQMEFSAKLARAQSMSVKTQQKPQGSGFLPQNIFKRILYDTSVAFRSCRPCRRRRTEKLRLCVRE